MQRIQTWIWGGLFLLLLFLAMFHGYIGQDRVLLTTDVAIGSANVSSDEVLRSVLPAWGDKVFMGGPSGGGSTPAAWMLLTVLPGILWNNLVYGLACLLGAGVLLWWLRKQSLCISAALLAGLTACWLGSNFTLLYPGHNLKPYVVLFFLLALIPAEQAAKGRLASCLLWGSCVGLMFVQQPDVALFFALFSGAYLVFRLWSAQGLRPLPWFKVLLPAMAMALLFAAGPLLSGYKYNVKDAAPVQTESAQAKWGYITQWSFPPEESIDFIAPGYTGWRSGEPDGPYWGRMGRSPGWEQTQQGYINFKLESVYLGFIPLAFALFALFSVLARGKYGGKGVGECRSNGKTECQNKSIKGEKDSDLRSYTDTPILPYSVTSRRAEILFWSAAAAVALLLAFGKFFPLYALFYQLPVVNNIRNPNKFLQVFQVALAILAAYGVDALLERRGQKIDARRQTPDASLPCDVSSIATGAKGETLAKAGRRMTEDRHQTPDARRQMSDGGGQKRDDGHQIPGARAFFWCLLGVLGVLGLWALGQTLGRGEDVARFVAFGWPPEVAGVMAQNKENALWYALLMAAVTAAVFAIYSFDWLQKLRRYGAVLAVGLVLLVAADAIKLSRHYVQDMPRSYIEANPLTDFLKANLGTQRAAMVTQQGIYNVQLSYLFPYQRIPVFNASQMPRMPLEYERLLQAGSKNPFGMWRFAAVKYLLAPTNFDESLRRDGCRKVFAYDIEAHEDKGYRVRPSPKGVYGVYEITNTLPRFALFTQSCKVADNAILQDLNQTGMLRLPLDTGLPVLDGKDQPGSLELTAYRPGRVHLKAETTCPAILRFAEKYDPDWKAWIDGQPAMIERVDYLCQGIFLVPGRHEIVLRYAPALGLFYLQMTGYFLLALLGCWMVWRRYGSA